MRSAKKNCYQNFMTISRIRLDCVFADPFGKSASAIMDYLLSDKPFDEKECLSLINGGAKASDEDILGSIRGCEILSEQRFKISHTKAHMISFPVPLANWKLNFSVGADPLMPRSSALPPSLALLNFLPCSSFSRSARTCPFLNLINTSVHGMNSPLPIASAPTRRHLQDVPKLDST